MTRWTTITLSKETKIKLAKIGKFGQSYEDVITKLLSKTEVSS